VWIRFDTSAPSGASFTHSIDISRPVRGFFLTRYWPLAPP
jgi:hypothetical protein